MILFANIYIYLPTDLLQPLPRLLQLRLQHQLKFLKDQVFSEVNLLLLQLQLLLLPHQQLKQQILLKLTEIHFPLKTIYLKPYQFPLLLLLKLQCRGQFLLLQHPQLHLQALQAHLKL